MENIRHLAKTMLLETLISPDESVGKILFLKWVFLSQQQKERKKRKQKKIIEGKTAFH